MGAAALKDHLVFTTDPTGGVLRKIGDALGVPMFDLPAGSGRTVLGALSAVGLLPAALTGHGRARPARRRPGHGRVDRGTAEAGRTRPAPSPASSILEDTVLGRRVSVMMPYSARLRDLADWYRQLWAESLGKAIDRQGRTVNVGPLPVKALGVTDQHSQLQLYAEGPDDKVITFLGVGEFARDGAHPGARARRPRRSPIWAATPWPSCCGPSRSPRRGRWPRRAGPR